MTPHSKSQETFIQKTMPERIARSKVTHVVATANVRKEEGIRLLPLTLAILNISIIPLFPT